MESIATARAATLGSQKFSAAVPATSATNIVWSDGHSVHVDGVTGDPGQVLVGPPGDEAFSLVISPNGSKVAINFQPAPGTPGARKGGVVVIDDLATGSTTTVPGSIGALNMLAWSPDSTWVFFAQWNAAGTSVNMASYLIGSRRATPLPIPGLRLPVTFNGASGSVIVGDTARGG